MIQLRKAQDRGQAHHGWLDTWHTLRLALSWMSRPRPGIKWQTPVRAAKNRSSLDLTSYQPHHSS